MFTPIANKMALAQILSDLIQTVHTKISATTDTQWGLFVYNEQVILMDVTSRINGQIEKLIEEINLSPFLERTDIQQLLELMQKLKDVTK